MFVDFDYIKKSLGGSVVLNGVSFGVSKGDIFGLIGKSGCGKSTLLNIFMGILDPDSGVVRVDSKNISKNLKFHQSKIGFASQENTLFNELTIEENAFYFARVYGFKKKEVRDRVDSLLELLSLDYAKKSLVGNLSGGMKKRANLLVSLIHQPEILVLDEPTTGLDSILRDSFWKYIRKINREEQLTVFVTSHLLDEIEENCSRLAIMKKGNIVAKGKMSDYRKEYGNDVKIKEVFENILK